jgi:hypothetical protein
MKSKRQEDLLSVHASIILARSQGVYKLCLPCQDNSQPGNWYTQIAVVFLLICGVMLFRSRNKRCYGV